MDLNTELLELLKSLFVGALVGLAIVIPLGLLRKYRTGKFWREESTKPESLSVFYWCVPLLGFFAVVGYLFKGPMHGAFFLLVTTICIGSLIARKVSQNRKNP